MRVIERATGTEYEARYIEGGYEIVTIEGERYKKLKDSTFKKYFKIPVLEKNKAEKEGQTNNSPSEDKTPEFGEVEHVSEDKRKKMIDKIKKMLTLAENNPSMEEGLSAALQAQKLMMKYNIHEDEVLLEEIKDEICSVFTQLKHNSQLHTWRKPLASIVARNFRCKCYLSGKDVVFRGYKEDADIATQVYTSLYIIGNSLGSKLYNHKRLEDGSGKGVYNSFVAGFLKGVESGFNKQCTALLVITPKEVEEEFQQFSATFTESASTLKVYDYESYRKGEAEGKAAVNSRSIEKKGKR